MRKPLFCLSRQSYTHESPATYRIDVGAQSRGDIAYVLERVAVDKRCIVSVEENTSPIGRFRNLVSQPHECAASCFPRTKSMAAESADSNDAASVSQRRIPVAGDAHSTVSPNSPSISFKGVKPMNEESTEMWYVVSFQETSTAISSRLLRLSGVCSKVTVATFTLVLGGL